MDGQRRSLDDILRESFALPWRGRARAASTATQRGERDDAQKRALG
jgi:hypothetical protein